MSERATAGQSISLPKGGGALQGIGEKFSPDLHSGTGNFTIPLELPRGRSGLQPELRLAYSTGSGNGPFGLGWNVAVPMISRKTAKGVPRYRDGAADPRLHDTFVLSGGEDLVPVPGGPPGVQRYRPRTEGLFARIEHHQATDHWEVTGKDGLLSRFGTFQSGEVGAAAVADPAAPGRVFAWKLTETVDPFGNRVEYRWRRDRGSDACHLWDQLYLEQVRWVDYRADAGEVRFLLTVDLDYEDRPDPFSDHRAGFEVRTRQRCVRIALRTHAGAERLVRSWELAYLDQRPELADQLPANAVSLLSRVRVVGHDGGRTQELPPLDLGYTRFEPAERDFFPLSGRGDLPARSLADADLELVDLFGNGLPDILEMNGGVRYWRNRGGGSFDLPREMTAAPAGLRLGEAGVQLLDADGDGRADLLVSRGSVAGYYPLAYGGLWDRRSFRPFAAAPTFSLEDPEVRLVDLNGDGVTDAIRAGSRLECFFQEARRGWSEVRAVERRALAAFPDVHFSDPRVRWADMGGDGLPDVVLVHDGRVEYWPSQGWGDWGRRVVMRNSPRFPEGYDPRRILLGDVDGDGAADLLYVEDGRVTLWINRSGEGWSAPVVVRGTPPVADTDSLRLADVLGNGIAGLLWSVDAGRPARDRLCFLDFTGGTKPCLLDATDNHAGAQTRIEYASSTRYYLADEARPGMRWRTPLPFPVQVVARVEMTDGVSGGRLVNEYTYHHGYWDGAEREFRGFGRVDQRDTQTLTETAAAPPGYSRPLETRTWFYQGPVGDELGHWEEPDRGHEYWPEDPPAFERPAAMAEMLASLPRRARREALRTLRGRVLRTEVYARDGGEREGRPYLVSETLHGVCEEETPAEDAERPRIFFPHPLAERSTEWERGAEPRTRYVFTGDHDAWGQPRSQLGVAVQRAGTAGEPYLVTHTVTAYAEPAPDGPYIADRVARVTVHGITGTAGLPVEELHQAVLAGSPALEREVLSETLAFYDGAAFEGLPLGRIGAFGAAVRAERLVVTPEILARAYGAGGIPAYLAGGGWSPEYPAEFQSLLPARAGYVERPAGGGIAGGLYVAAELRRYDFHETPDGSGRGLPRATRDPLGHETTYAYDPYGLLPTLVNDPVGLTTRATYDYRVLQPREVADANGNRSLFAYTPLGLLESTAAMGRTGEEVGDTPEAPGTRLVYDLSAWAEGRGPVSVRTLRRLHHAHDSEVPADVRGATVEQVEYSDGFGRLVQTRLEAEEVAFGEPVFGDAGLTADPAHLAPAVARQAAAGDPPRVVVTGWQVYDNKGRVVARYEPFFSTGWTYAAPAERELGRKVVLTYDPMGRVVRTTAPDGSEQRMVYGVPLDLADPDRFTPTPWEVYSYDANDNAGRTHPDAGAAWQAHWNTPASSVLDALGRTVESVARNGPDPTDRHVSRSAFDLQGNLLVAVDPLGRTTFRHVWDLAGRALRTEQLDAGTRLLAVDAGGNVVERRDGRGALVLQSYDASNRPLRVWARDAAGLPVTLRERLVYGDTLPPDQARAGNLRGRLHRHYDEAGLLTYEAYDFKANVVEKVRRTIRDAEIRAVLDPTPANGWQVTPYRVDWQPPRGTSLDAWARKLLEETAYRTTAAYDALNRVETLRYPQDVTGRRRVLRPRYNRAGALERVELDGEVFVERVAYDAKGQRILVAYGNGVMTRYAYDRTLLRLARLRSEHWRRGAEAPLTYAPAGLPPLQDLWFEYDLAGNPLGIEERTPGCGVENNPDAARVGDPALAGLLVRGDALLRRFGYDPLYRLRAATGRQCKTNFNPRPWTDDQRCEHVFRGFPGPDNGPKLTVLYRESYEYDPAGNLLALAHSNPDAAWTRRFGVGGRSPEEWREEWPAHLGAEEWPDAPGNQVTHAIDDGAASPRTHWHDANGNLVRETASRHCHWDHADRLALYRTQAPDARPTVYAAYLYDARGRRVKKLVGGRGSQPAVTVYVDGFFEHHRTGPHENNTLYVMDDQKRIATVRAGNPIEGDNSPPVRYHLADHLGSSSVVVDGTGASVNREEYSPYGETVFGSFARKRYRYAGKERDEESGLYSFGARYYAPWLGAWTSCDPRPQSRAASLYRYGGSSPLKMVDPLGETEESVLSKWLEITIDHIEARAAGGPHVDPDNLSFLPRSDNSSKGARPEGPRTRNAPQSLGGAKSAEEFSKAAQNMLSRSFGETEELRRLWNTASQGGKLAYEDAQSAFWKLVEEGTDPDAKLVKEALAEAGIEKMPNSTRFRINPGATGLKGKPGVAPGSIKPGQFAGRWRGRVGGVVRGAAPGIAWGFMENLVQRNIAEAEEMRARTGGTEERPTEDEIRANELQGWRYERVDGKTQWKWDPPFNIRLRNAIRHMMNSIDPDYQREQQQKRQMYYQMQGLQA